MSFNFGPRPVMTPGFAQWFTRRTLSRPQTKGQALQPEAPLAAPVAAVPDQTLFLADPSTGEPIPIDAPPPGQAPPQQPQQRFFPQRPGALVLPERSYDIPGVVPPPPLPAAPTRDLAAENARAQKAALLPAGLALLMGGAPAAAAAAQGVMQGAKGRMDAEALVANQKWQADRQGKLQEWSMDRQVAGDKAQRVGMQMSADARHDSNLVRAKQDELRTWQDEMDRLQKAYEAADNRELKASIAQAMDETRRIGLQVQAALGGGRLQDSQTRTKIMDARQKSDAEMAKNLFGLRSEDMKADNTRADKSLDLDRWYKTRAVGISQGRLDLVREKGGLDGEMKGIKSWQDAQPKIAEYNQKAARLLKGHADIFGDVTPPTEDEQIAAHMYIEAGHNLAGRFGKEWKTDQGQWGDLAPPAGGTQASAPNISPYVVPPVDPNLPTRPAPQPTPQPKVQRPPTPNPSIKITGRATSSPAPRPRPSATPKPAKLMSREEIAREIAAEFAKTGKKK